MAKKSSIAMSGGTRPMPKLYGEINSSKKVEPKKLQYVKGVLKPALSKTMRGK
jgi:hypothetical protein